MRKNWELFKTFFKLGCFTFGGGMAMMPLLIKEVVDKKQWLSNTDVVDFYAIAQTIPGIIAANVATMVGHRVNKFWGALFSLLGMIIPSIVIIIIIAALLNQFSDVVWVKNALKGINIAVIVMLLGLLINLRKNIFDIITVLIALIGFILMAFFNVTPTLVILGSAVLGAIFYSKKVLNK